MKISDVKTLKSSLFDFSINTSSSPQKESTGFLSYGATGYWLFDENKSQKTQINLNSSEIQKIKLVLGLQKNKKFTAKVQNDSKIIFNANINDSVIIELNESDIFPENSTPIEFFEENELSFIRYKNDSGTYVSYGFKIAEIKDFFNHGGFDNTANLIALCKCLDSKDISVLTRIGNRLQISIKGTVKINSLAANGINDNDIGEIHKEDSDKKEIFYFHKRLSYTLTLRDSDRTKELTDIVNSGKILLCQVLNVSDTAVQILIQQYENERNRQLIFKEVPIKITNELSQKLHRFGFDAHIDINGKKYFVCQFADKEKNYVFTIFTKYLRIKVEKVLAYGKLIDGNKYTLNVKSIESRRENNIIPNLSLVEGKISFVDKEIQVRDEINQAIDSLIESESSYLQTWDKYAELKGNDILERGRNFDVLFYKSLSFETDTHGKKVNITLSKSLPKNIDILTTDSFDIYENTESNENVPVYLKKENKDMDWKAYYQATVDSDGDTEKSEDEKLAEDINQLSKKPAKKKDSREAYGDRANVTGLRPVKIFKGNDSPMILDFYYDKKYTQDSFPKTGHIVLSIYAEEIQIKRQEQARRMISAGKNAMPELRVLLEDAIENIPTQKKLEHKELLPYFSQKIFGERGPNEKQLEAIYTALESPDIAVIQGPPGTGKTTVICAILEMYNYLHNKRASNKGLYLVTSYQHAAVENVIDRLRLNGSPTFKFGKKSGQIENYDGNIRKYIEEIKNNQIENYIKDKYGKIPSELTSKDYENLREKFFNDFGFTEDENLAQLDECFAEYNTDPSKKNKIKLLKALKAMQDSSTDCKKRIEALLHSTENEVFADGYLPLLTFVRALRTDKISYQDDGIARAKELIQGENKEFIKEIFEQIAPEKTESYLGILDKASDSIGNSFNDFDELKKIQLLLLDFLCEPPEYIKSHKDSQLVDLYKTIRKECKRRPKDEKTRILSDWIQTLDFNKAGISEAIKKWDVAYSATAQQSIGKDITQEKRADKFSTSIGKEKDNFSYDVVVIDEAARATPPDLLIPMSRGKEKIILVGDHRQLPHLIDTEIAKKLAENEDADENDTYLTENTSEKNLKYSMFQILFEHFKKIEANGGIKRVVTLNKQYRMHPTLGNFASKQFYEPYGEGFDSPRPKSDFTHDLPRIQNKCAVWIDVPMTEDTKDQKKGNSRFRSAEAKAIICKLLEWKQNDAGKNLSYGIITFYRAQADYIRDLAKKNSELAEGLGNGSIQIDTVDAFQGMEFDVVFLSVVRTSAGKNQDHKYGFLTSKNRLCVALTRQKKLLAICGDSGLLNLDDARDKTKGIPELCAFYDELCKGEDGAIL